MIEARRTWQDALKVYTRPVVLTMLFLGFSAGLPFLLVFSTLTAWLRAEGIEVAAIGFFSWIGILYSIKFIWAPVVDRLPLPGVTRVLGQRRGWMLLGQALIMTGLAGLAFSDPTASLTPIVFLALMVAFGSATQDIAIDAFRIESAPDDMQAANAATYMIGYRIGLVMAGAVALNIADLASWTAAYLAMAALVSVGVATVLIRPEPSKRVTRVAYEREQRVQDYLAANPHHSQLSRRVMAWLIGAVVCPFVDFFTRYGKYALALLVLVGIYRISDISMAAMANPLYIDLGFSLSEIGTITNAYGIVMTIVGGLVGGLMVTRYGIARMLVVGAALTAVTNLFFAWLAVIGSEIAMLVVTISADNISNGFASTVLIAFMSSLTSRAYTATQYALFSSLMTLPGKFVSGFSGIAVDAWGYPWFFIGIAIAGVPAVLLALWYAQRRWRIDAEPGGTDQQPEPAY